jgi:3-hydroxyisobutyrate dehydrogenase-like beta-hydroxyacid dehydrogenase
LPAAAGVEFVIRGAAMKLVVNSTLGAAIVALGEALMLGQSLGLERVVLDVLESSPIGPTVCAKRSNVESGRYPPSFKLNLADKDLRLVTEAGDTAGLDLKSARATRAWLDEAVDQGKGDLDFSAVVATITEGPQRGQVS